MTAPVCAFRSDTDSLTKSERLAWLILCFLTAPIILVARSAIDAWAAAVIWGWFLAAYPTPTRAVFLGVMLVVRLLLYRDLPLMYPGRPDIQFGRALGALLVGPLFVAMAWLIKWWLL